MSVIAKLKSRILKVPFLRHLWWMRLEPLALVYRLEDLTEAFYQKALVSGDVELEHQIGRLRNFKRIVGEIAAASLPGDVAEFGTWRGFSLHWLAFLFERQGIFDKKLIGVDGFVGLPGSEGVFSQGHFHNTSQTSVRTNLAASTDLYDLTKKNVFIEKFLYKEKDAVLSRFRELGVRQLVLVHLDADLTSSTLEILDILKSGGLLADTVYLLFDDWGCDTNLARTVEAALKRDFAGWTITEHSHSKLTKNFKLRRK